MAYTSVLYISTQFHTNWSSWLSLSWSSAEKKYVYPSYTYIKIRVVLLTFWSAYWPISSLLLVYSHPSPDALCGHCSEIWVKYECNEIWVQWWVSGRGDRWWEGEREREGVKGEDKWLTKWKALKCWTLGEQWYSYSSVKYCIRLQWDLLSTTMKGCRELVK